MAVNEDGSNLEAPTIGRLLLIWLQEAIDGICQKIEIANVQIGSSRIADSRLDTESFYLYLVKDETQVLHTTAIALKLSKLWQRPTMELAVEIALRLYHISRKSGIKAGECTIEVASSGLINLRSSDAGIATWLQRFAQEPPWIEQERVAGLIHCGQREFGEQGSKGAGERNLPNFSTLPEADLPKIIFSHHNELALGRVGEFPISSSQSIFPIQYAHARCCSLLRLAHREKTIVLAKPDPDRTPTHWRLVNPHSIPWLTASEQLRLIHPAERSLIYQLIGIADTLYCSPPKQLHSRPWVKLATNLSHSFEKFYSQCRIWGEVRKDAPELVQARLGLIMATQALLRLMLEDLLGFPAPLEL